MNIPVVPLCTSHTYSGHDKEAVSLRSTKCFFLFFKNVYEFFYVEIGHNLRISVFYMLLC
jgi:hypothetical protein